jgi:hypothetical protein
MGYSRTNPVGAVGDPTMKSDYDTLFDNADALRSLGALEVHLGGDYSASQNTDTSTPGSNILGYVIVQIDGTEITSSHLECFFEAMCWNTNATDETHVELYNITDAQVEATIDLQDTTPTRRRSSAISIPAGNKEYKALYYVDNTGTGIFVAAAKMIFL